jgi:hypothetical protein
MPDLDALLLVITARDIGGLVRAQEKYGDSWRKRGGWEAFANLSRKWDRIERAVLARPDKDLFAAIKEHPAADGTVDGKDSLLDDLRDLRRYLLLVESYVLNGEQP